ncbi:MAG: LicD family protein [Firmicutes bacterium]|nr:LicD family protein [Bacillota bacterium]
MTQEELRQIGEVQLDIMDEVHRICVNHNLTYYMIAGTLLGAVRHRGFIPWDLDIDIGMPRKDYEKFREIARNEALDRFTYMDYESCKNYIRPHALMVRNDTRIHLKYDRWNRNVMDLGVYIDIFPLDNAPDEEKLRAKQDKKLKKLRRIKDMRLPYCYSGNAFRRFVHAGISFLLSWRSVQKLNRKQQAWMQKYSHCDTKCICSMASQYTYKKQCMPREIYGAPVLLEFEGRQYYAPREYTRYLTRLYGDYMQLPPPEKRQANLEIFTSVEFSKRF